VFQAFLLRLIPPLLAVQKQPNIESGLQIPRIKIEGLIVVEKRLSLVSLDFLPNALLENQAEAVGSLRVAQLGPFLVALDGLHLVEAVLGHVEIPHP